MENYDNIFQIEFKQKCQGNNMVVSITCVTSHQITKLSVPFISKNYIKRTQPLCYI